MVFHKKHLSKEHSANGTVTLIHDFNGENFND